VTLNKSNIVQAESGILLTHKRTNQWSMFGWHTFPHKPLH